MRNIRYIVVLVFLIFVSRNALSQSVWDTSGNDIYNTNTGNVGIGTTNPESMLSVLKTSPPVGTQNSVIMDLSAGAASDSVGQQEVLRMYRTQTGYTYSQVASFSLGRYTAGIAPKTRLDINLKDSSGDNHVTDATIMTLQSNGNVGIGMASPGFKMSVTQDMTMGSDVLDGTAQMVIQGATTIGKKLLMGYDTNDNGFGFIKAGNQGVTWTPLALQPNGGNVGIGTTNPQYKLDVNGSINVSGNINAKYQDLAEWVPSTTAIKAGYVVITDPKVSGNVVPSFEAYDTRVAGVVSETPGIILGESGSGKVKVATVGRVKVKADASKNPINIGDLLVSSNNAGIAMKSEAVEIGGIKMHRPGTLIGKALESLESGQGEIMVLLSLQ
jgi:hypothetical protein